MTALIRAGAIHRVLIVAPVSVLYNWEKELHENMDDYLDIKIPTGLVEHRNSSAADAGGQGTRKFRVRIDVMSSDVSQKKRLQMLQDAFSTGAGKTSHSNHHVHIVITSYQLVTNMVDAFCYPSHLTSSSAGRYAPSNYWDYVVLDEGHLIKNRKTKMAEAMASLPSRNRVMLTGR
jgi:SNF2 family DNA or RNA helicase